MAFQKASAKNDLGKADLKATLGINEFPKNSPNPAKMRPPGIFGYQNFSYQRFSLTPIPPFPLNRPPVRPLDFPTNRKFIAARSFALAADS